MRPEMLLVKAMSTKVGYGVYCEVAVTFSAALTVSNS